MVRTTLIGTVAAAIGMATSSTAAPINDCGDLVKVGAGVYNVTSRGAPCSVARRFPQRFYRSSCGRSGKSVCQYAGYTCRTRRIGSELFDTRCVNGSKVIRWQSGS
jgi:hypothetical protein